MPSNLPPGCSVSQIPGNRPEEALYEAAWEWAEEQLRELSLQDFKRAILIGKAAVAAEESVIKEMLKDQRSEGYFLSEALNSGDGTYRP